MEIWPEHHSLWVSRVGFEEMGIIRKRKVKESWVIISQKMLKIFSVHQTEAWSLRVTQTRFIPGSNTLERSRHRPPLWILANRYFFQELGMSGSIFIFCSDHSGLPMIEWNSRDSGEIRERARLENRSKWKRNFFHKVLASSLLIDERTQFIKGKPKYSHVN